MAQAMSMAGMAMELIAFSYILIPNRHHHASTIGGRD